MKKAVPYVIVFLLLAQSVKAQTTLEVSIKNIKEPKGTIRVGLFNNEKDFLKKPVDGKVVDVTSHSVAVMFENLQPGDYAISVIHDKNSNGDLDTNIMGIPKEGFGFGNDSMGLFGPPSFDKAKVTVKEGLVKAEITLKYF
ncbi:DUF2141 domain-containing protein [Chryseosolibacter indicus]|uniref:DUF2141 domain-containing protein n=1 Tax=Chryseosolibacter indicus TaxID=2782351 RepID=A0ABS5VMJ9_9BACT|nr:DUF2141 domain-containing protein [Chryseosolibacter indicus]MBT1702074.1 DUF2141 domain-containing protein [Chryseosolibacter indicus]